MTRRVRHRGAFAAAVAAVAAMSAAAGCRRTPDDAASGPPRTDTKSGLPQSSEELGEPVAMIDDVVITVSQLQESLNRQSPYVRARYASKEQKRVFLDNLVRFEVLAKEAARRGLDKDPEVIQTMKSAMITKLLKAELASAVKPDDIPEPELRAFFEANPRRWNRPEEVRVSAIVLDKAKQAGDVGRLARGVEGQSNKGFRDLVSKYSTDAESKLRGGDLRYVGRDATHLPRPVVDAAFQLTRTGEVAGPIEADGKFYILKQTGRRTASEKSFEQVKREIQNELYKERRDGSQRQLVDELRAKSKIQVFDENLRKVRVDTSGRAAAPPADEPGTAGGTR